MCGILGYIKKNNNISSNEDIIFDNSLDLLHHRGPNATGIFKEAGVLLGHKRLSIIDTSAGANQPFQIDGYTLIFNGEIYNFREIKEELLTFGYKFKTHSDTEVLLYGYIHRGKDCVKKFDGMWAFCIYDHKKNELFVSRDRIGEKPFVYFLDKEKFVFSSELPSLLALLPQDQIHVDNKVLSNFNLYNLQHIPSPYTPYQHIWKLEPGFSMIINLNTFICKKEKYFEIDHMPIKRNAVAQFDDLFKIAVEKTCFADVPVGILLSGGIDSSLITAVLKDRNITTYSLGYDNHDEETLRSAKIAKHLNVKNKTIYFKDYLEDTNLIDLIKINLQYYGEPINLFQIIYSDILLKEMKKDGIVVVVGGNGADELFYGYNGMNLLGLLSLGKSILDFLHLNTLFAKIPPLWFIGYKNDSIKSQIYQKELEKKSYIKKEYQHVLFADILKDYAHEIPSKKLMDIFSWMGLRMENEHSITIVNDLAGAMNSMEVRTPFLNKPILDFSCNLGWTWKIKSFISKKRNKYILKKALEKYLPKSLIYKKKMGFGYGIKYDNFVFDYQKDFEHYIFTIVPKIKIYDAPTIQQLFENHINKKENHNQTLIEILIMAIWYETFCI